MLRPYGATKIIGRTSSRALEEDGVVYSPELIQSLEHTMIVIGGSNFLGATFMRGEKKKKEKRRREETKEEMEQQQVSPLFPAKAVIH